MPTETLTILALVASAILGAMLAGLYFTAQRRTSVSAQASAPARPTDVSGWPADRQGLIDSLDIGVVRLDARLDVVRTNRAADRMLHLDDRPVARRSLMEIVLDHRVEDAARKALEVGSSTAEMVTADGEERRLVVRIRSADEGGLWLTLDDVTELRRLQRIRSEFIDNLSHELRTPLTTIRLLTETLLQDLEHADVPPRIRERVNKIDVETGHLVQMVNELLDLSRIESGAAELHLESVDMRGVVLAALDRLRTFAERQGVTLAANLPEPSELPRVKGDEERLQQVLVNLLHNAAKFSPAGTTVEVAARESGDHVTIEVRDHGVGIPRADVDRVFERFYKVDKSHTPGRGGTGLGLSIARHIVEGHGGRIWAHSEDGKGSTFTFTVPLA